MIVIKIELHSANTGAITEIGRMVVTNDGTCADPKLGNYEVRLMRRGTLKVQRIAQVKNYPRLSLPVWSLVQRALKVLQIK